MSRRKKPLDRGNTVRKRVNKLRSSIHLSDCPKIVNSSNKCTCLDWEELDVD